MNRSKILLVLALIFSSAVLLAGCSKAAPSSVSPDEIMSSASAADSLDGSGVIQPESTDGHSENPVSSAPQESKENEKNVSAASDSSKKSSKASAVSKVQSSVSRAPSKSSSVKPQPSVDDKKISVGVSVTGEDKEVILPSVTVTLDRGATVFDATKKALDTAGLVFDYSGGRVSAYVEGIDGLYAEGMSGWLYEVNGSFDNCNKGCGQYALSSGDSVRWVYTADGGKDVGADYLS